MTTFLVCEKREERREKREEGREKREERREKREETLTWQMVAGMDVREFAESER